MSEFPIRATLKNRFNKITYAQFSDYLNDFLYACEESFETQCSGEIKFMSTSKLTSNFDCGDMDFVKKWNDDRTFAKATIPNNIDILFSDWLRAYYIELNVRPINPDLAKQSAWGQLSFNKGVNSKSAKLYIQCGRDIPTNKMIYRKSLLVSKKLGHLSLK